MGTQLLTSCPPNGCPFSCAAILPQSAAFYQFPSQTCWRLADFALHLVVTFCNFRLLRLPQTSHLPAQMLSSALDPKGPQVQILNRLTAAAGIWWIQVLGLARPSRKHSFSGTTFLAADRLLFTIRHIGQPLLWRCWTPTPGLVPQRLYRTALLSPMPIANQSSKLGSTNTGARTFYRDVRSLPAAYHRRAALWTCSLLPELFAVTEAGGQGKRGLS